MNGDLIVHEVGLSITGYVAVEQLRTLQMTGYRVRPSESIAAIQQYIIYRPPLTAYLSHCRSQRFLVQVVSGVVFRPNTTGLKIPCELLLLLSEGIKDIEIVRSFGIGFS